MFESSTRYEKIQQISAENDLKMNLYSQSPNLGVLLITVVACVVFIVY